MLTNPSCAELSQKVNITFTNFKQNRTIVKNQNKYRLIIIVVMYRFLLFFIDDNREGGWGGGGKCTNLRSFWTHKHSAKSKPGLVGWSVVSSK